MKLALISTVFASAAAFAPSKVAQSTSALYASLEGVPGALAPMGIFDPLGLAEKLPLLYLLVTVRLSSLTDAFPCLQ